MLYKVKKENIKSFNRYVENLNCIVVSNKTGRNE